MKNEKTKQEEINEAVKDLHSALLANIVANEKIIEVNREKTSTRFALLKAKERLAMLELSFN